MFPRERIPAGTVPSKGLRGGMPCMLETTQSCTTYYPPLCSPTASARSLSPEIFCIFYNKSFLQKFSISSQPKGKNQQLCYCHTGQHCHTGQSTGQFCTNYMSARLHTLWSSVIPYSKIFGTISVHPTNEVLEGINHRD